jgi:polyphenol oxidase
MMLRVANLTAPVVHGFFTRAGGVSDGVYASLNCSIGSGDDPAKVAENRGRALEALGLARDSLVTGYQVHGKDVAVVDDIWRHADRPKVDALVTRRRGIALGILTADCVPVLLADPGVPLIAAAHAGWRGAVGGVLEETLAVMREQGAELARIRAGVGPAIGAASYEVGPEFPAAFLAERAENRSYFRPAPRDKHFLFDLGGYVAEKLARLGVGNVARSGGDTAAEPQHFFSWRRTALAGETRFGHMLSAIALAGIPDA